MKKEPNKKLESFYSLERVQANETADIANKFQSGIVSPDEIAEYFEKMEAEKLNQMYEESKEKGFIWKAKRSINNYESRVELCRIFLERIQVSFLL